MVAEVRRQKADCRSKTKTVLHPTSQFSENSKPSTQRMRRLRGGRGEISRLDAWFSFSSRGAFAPVHGFVGEAVGVLVVFAESVADFYVLDLAGQVLGFVVELAQLGMAHLVDAFHLANHEFGITDDSQGLDLMRDGVAESGEKPVVLGVIVGVVAEVLA